MRMATYSDSRALDAFLKAVDELVEGEGSAKDRVTFSLSLSTINSYRLRVCSRLGMRVSSSPNRLYDHDKDCNCRY